MTRNKIIKISVVTLAAAAVLFAITSNVAEAAKINPNPMGKPSTGGTKKTDGCMIANSACLNGNYTAGDMYGCQPRRDGAKCRKKNLIARCEKSFQKCRKKKGKAKQTLPSKRGTIMKTVPMKQYKMAPTKKKSN